MNLAFDCTFRDEETGTDQRFFTCPIIAGCITEVAYGVEQSFARKSGATLIDALKRLLAYRSSFGSC